MASPDRFSSSWWLSTLTFSSCWDVFVYFTLSFEEGFFVLLFSLLEDQKFLQNHRRALTDPADGGSRSTLGLAKRFIACRKRSRNVGKVRSIRHALPRYMQSMYSTRDVGCAFRQSHWYTIYSSKTEKKTKIISKVSREKKLSPPKFHHFVWKQLSTNSCLSGDLALNHKRQSACQQPTLLLKIVVAT